MLHARAGFDSLQQRYQQRPPNALPAATLAHIDAPDPSLVPRLGDWIAEETRHAHKLAFVESAKDKVIVRIRRQAFGGRLHGGLAMLLGGFAEGLRFAFQGLQPQVPVGLGITFGQESDFDILS